MSTNTLRGKRLLTFTSGGISPSLNPTLYGVITQARKRGMRVLGGLYGWACLLNRGRIIDVTNIDVRSLAKRGGSFLFNSRKDPMKDGATLKQVKERLKNERIDYVVAIGGNDTLTRAHELYQKINLPIVGVPKTVDNDLSGTYWSPGFPSAAWRFAEYIYYLNRDVASGRKRIFVVEAIGGCAGWLTSASCYGGADIILPPEKPVPLDKLLKRVLKKYNTSKKCLVVVSDHAKIKGLNKSNAIAFGLEKEIEKNLGIFAKSIIPGNLIEAGNPIEIDARYSVALGRKSIDLLARKKFDEMAALDRKGGGKHLNVVAVPLAKAIGEKNYFAMTSKYFDFDNFWPKKEYLDYMAPVMEKFEIADHDYNSLRRKIKYSK